MPIPLGENALVMRDLDADGVRIAMPRKSLVDPIGVAYGTLPNSLPGDLRILARAPLAR